MPQPPMYPEQDPWTEQDTRAVQQETGGDAGDCERNWWKHQKSDILMNHVEKISKTILKNNAYIIIVDF